MNATAMNEQAEISEGRLETASGGDVALIFIDNPPSGVINDEVRTSLFRQVAAAESDPAIKAIVLAGKDGAFAMGTTLEPSVAADDDEEAELEDLAALCDRIEALEKPVVAAITGPALGNGLELALAAHARVVSPSSRLGAPEITIGLVPGAGGTQRLPKVVGGLAALKMLLSGRAVNGTSAKKLGLADALVETDVVEAAVEMAREMAFSGEPLKRSSTRRDRLGEGNAFLEAVAEHRRAAEASALDAPLRLIECVEAALLLPYEVGRGLEAAAFEDLVASDHSKALRHVFAAERRLAAAARAADQTTSRTLTTVGLLGARGVGSEIAVTCMDAGFHVVLAEASDEALEVGVARIIEHYDAQVAAGKMTEDAVEDTLDRLQASSGYAMLADADVVIDPGPSITRAQIGQVDAVLKAGAVIATGTEQIDVDTIAGATRRAPDVAGFRLFPEMRRNRLAEIVPGRATNPRAIATLRAFAGKLDRMVIVTGPGPTGIGQRIEEALHAAADLCVLQGASIGRVDAVLRDWGLPHGSFAARDLRGLGRRARKGRTPGLGALVAGKGRMGHVSGRGFYTYRNRGRAGIEDEAVMAMIVEERQRLNIAPRAMPDREVRVQCLAAMAGAGAALLADGTAARPADIDMVAIHGLGFARRTGGVMFAADLLGLERVKALLTEMSEASPRIPPPSPIFDDLIAAKKGFERLNG